MKILEPSTAPRVSPVKTHDVLPGDHPPRFPDRVAGAWCDLIEHRFGGAVLFVLGFLVVSFLTRAALLVQAGQQISWKPSLLGAFAWGALFDLAAAGWWSLPVVLALALAPRRAFSRVLVNALVHAAIFLVLCALLFVGVAEWFFWDEFGARFNFIAVDYLVYTHEVIGNIRESYPMPLILGAIIAAAALIQTSIIRLGWTVRWMDSAEAGAGARWRFAAVWIVAVVALGLGLNEEMIPSLKNNYTREIAKNGPWSFVAAFRANRLEYEHFYPTRGVDASFARVKAQLSRDGAVLASPAEADLLRRVPAPRPGLPELRPNIIQITVESLSADFLGRYGDKQGLTPNLDALCDRSLVFDRFYATGNRTDRGMEALTLAVPPTPGRSLVKRADNAGLFTLGSVLRTRGYDTAFIYGGYGYFDNMNAFFGGNGYRVVDRKSFAADEVTFANAWGACDEDLFNRSLREADRLHAEGKPFFQFLMTTSNHRPFTYPDGRIDLPSKTSRRSGGVKYTDYAIGKFLRDAAAHPWFRDTVFVIVADHCASSAGRTELPVQNYHIPLIIHAPGGQIAPGVVRTLASQVDYAPTLLGLLNWSYDSRFFGWDVTAPDAPPGRALIGNYQKLGYFDGQRLAVLSPVRQSRAYSYRAKDNTLTPDTSAPSVIEDAIGYYETACWTLGHGRQLALPPSVENAH